MSKPLVVGEVVKIIPPQHVPSGREQQMPRPARVVATPGGGLWGKDRWKGAMILVVPFTSQKGHRYATENPALYPSFKVGAGGLPQPSIALLDQAFTYDVGRGVRRTGHLSPTELEVLRAPLRRMLGGP